RCRSAVDVVEQFRMRMDVAPPGGDLAMQVGDAIDDRHLVLICRGAGSGRDNPFRKDRSNDGGLTVRTAANPGRGLTGAVDRPLLTGRGPPPTHAQRCGLPTNRSPQSVGTRYPPRFGRARSSVVEQLTFNQ